MDWDEAKEFVGSACEYLVDEIGDGGMFYDFGTSPDGTAETYRAALTYAVNDLMKGYDGLKDLMQEDDGFLSAQFEKLVNWVLFMSGAEIRDEEIPDGHNGKYYPVVRVDRFDINKMNNYIDDREKQIKKIVELAERKGAGSEKATAVMTE